MSAHYERLYQSRRRRRLMNAGRLPKCCAKREPDLEARWCRSLYHDWAQLVKTDGSARCDSRVRSGMWIPVSAGEVDDLHKCLRCMGSTQKGGEA